MNKVAVLLAALVLAGCQTADPTIVTTKLETVRVPEELFDCPVVKSFPKSATLTDAQVSSLLITLTKNNIRCKNSLESIKNYLESAEKTITEQQ